MTIKENEVTKQVIKQQPLHYENKSPNKNIATESFDEITALLEAAKTDDNNSIKRIIITENIFRKIKEGLITTIKNMEKNPSLFSRAAEFWGQLPLWQKILGGIAITAPTLILGIVANISFLLAICGITAIIYTGGGIILQDHYNHTESITDSLSEGIIGLANLLELTITALNAIREKLTDEVKKFSEENTKFQENNVKLATQLEQLGKDIQATSALNVSLKHTKDKLEQAAISLSNQVAEQGDLLNIKQEELNKVTQKYNESQVSLSEKIAEFAKVKTKLELELDKTQQVAATLQSTVTQLASTVITDKQHQQEFKERLDTFFKDKAQSFDSIAGRFSESEKKLALTEEKLRQCNQKYQAHIQEMQHQIERLTQIADRHQQIKARSNVQHKDCFFPKSMDTGNITPSWLKDMYTTAAEKTNISLI